MDEIAILLSAYCDNDLSDEERLRLVAWLREDPAHVDRLTRTFQAHSQLYDFLKQHQLQSDAWSQALDTDIVSTADQSPNRSNPAPSIKLGRWMLSVAAILACVFIGIVTYFVFSGPDVVAQISNANGDVIMSNGKKVLAGALLSTGEVLRADRGEMIVTFECGTKMMIEAPAAFVIDGKTSCTLTRGGASVRVPTQAIGFAVHTPLANIVDLGTEFRVQILDEDRLDLHVFDGLVEVSLDDRFDNADDGPLRISEGRSARFDAAANKIITLKYDKSLRQEF